MLEDSSQILQFLTSAAPEFNCRVLAPLLNLDPATLIIPPTNEPFDIMLNMIVDSEQVTVKRLAEVLESPPVGCNALARIVLQHDFYEFSQRYGMFALFIFC